jgi:hypothetical protein
MYHLIRKSLNSSNFLAHHWFMITLGIFDKQHFYLLAFIFYLLQIILAPKFI